MCKPPLMQKMGFAGGYSRCIGEHLEIDVEDLPPPTFISTLLRSSMQRILLILFVFDFERKTAESIDTQGFLISTSQRDRILGLFLKALPRNGLRRWT